MTTNDRLREKITELLEPGENIISTFVMIGSPGRQAGDVHAAARAEQSARGRYMAANNLDPEQGWQHLANDGMIALTDRRALLFEAKLAALRPTPKAIAWSAPIEGVSLGWADVKIKGIQHRMMHLWFGDGTWTVQFVLRSGNFFRKPKPDETDLLIEALGASAVEVTIPEWEKPSG